MKRTTAKKAKAVTFYVYVEPKQKLAMERLAKRDDVTVSALTRDIFSKYLSRREATA